MEWFRHQWNRLSSGIGNSSVEHTHTHTQRQGEREWKRERERENGRCFNRSFSFSPCFPILYSFLYFSDIFFVCIFVALYVCVFVCVCEWVCVFFCCRSCCCVGFSGWTLFTVEQLAKCGQHIYQNMPRGLHFNWIGPAGMRCDWFPNRDVAVAAALNQLNRVPS